MTTAAEEHAEIVRQIRKLCARMDWRDGVFYIDGEPSPFQPGETIPCIAGLEEQLKNSLKT